MFAKFCAVLLAVMAAATLGLSTPALAQVAPVDPDGSITNPVAPTPAQAPQDNTRGPSTAAGPTGPTGPTGAGSQSTGQASINLDINGLTQKPSQSLLIIMLLTVMSVAPALLMMLTSFTRIIIVLTLTRNALGIQSIPPNQVLTGLALFLSLFIMAPVFTQMNNEAIQPFIKGELTQAQAYEVGVQPLRKFMLAQTRSEELSLFVKASANSAPATPETVSMQALIPAFILSEIKTAFIIGFVVFIPFLVIDIIVSSSLMAMGMMMLPPQTISLPFKLLLFVLVDGWGLVVKSLLGSFA